MNHSFEVKEKDLQPGRMYLGLVQVKMNRMFIFGMQERLHEMVSFIPGMGNGAYEVYGEVKDVPGYGYRITKVEIELVSDEEIKYYEQKYSDHILEVAY